MRRFLDEAWIDAPMRPGKRPGAFCAYTVPSHHPYVLLNWTARRRDVLTLAHELGHGVHAYLARGQGVFHQTTPLTLAETASVFGETVTFGRLLAETTDPAARLALLAESLEGQIATVFRQIAMNRFEDAVHTERREQGELSVERFGDLWADTQTEHARRRGRDHRRLPHVVVLHPALHRDARVRVRLRVRAAARAVGVPAVRGARRRLRPVVPRAALARRFRHARGARSGRRASTSPTRSSGTAVSRSSRSSSTQPSRPRRTPAGSEAPERLGAAGAESGKLDLGQLLLELVEAHRPELEGAGVELLQVEAGAVARDARRRGRAASTRSPTL